jgi:hypothetical protein
MGLGEKGEYPANWRVRGTIQRLCRGYIPRTYQWHQLC